MLGLVLKLTRIANNITTKSVADKSGISSTFICDIENSRKKVSLENLKAIVKVYDIPLSKILFFEEKATEKQMNYQQILKMILEYYVYEKNNENSNEQTLSKTM